MKVGRVGAYFDFNLNPKRITKKEAAETIVAQTFSKVFYSMTKSPLFEENKLIKESFAEKWFKEMLYVEYTKLLAKKELKPLVDSILKSI